jgi:hypothetical protein
MLNVPNSKKLNLAELDNAKIQAESKSAGEWWCNLFPQQVKIYGAPFLEESQPNHLGGLNITPIVPNIDFFAGCLGGSEDLGHRIIYYPVELQFYYYDPRDKLFHATTNEKLGNLLRALFAKCAAEVKGEGHLFNLFHTFRSDQVTKAVVNRCKSVLAAGPDFFVVDSPNDRVQGPELHERLARVFAEKMLESCPDNILTIGQTYSLFNRFAQSRNLPPLDRTKFKSMMAGIIRDQFDLGVRNDLMNVETRKQQCGWKGLKPAGLA